MHNYSRPTFGFAWDCAETQWLARRTVKFKSRPGQKFGLRFLLHLRLLANSAMMSALTICCQWEDEMVRERIGHLPSYAEAKKAKSLTLHTHGCSRAILKGNALLLLKFEYSQSQDFKSFIKPLRQIFISYQDMFIAVI